MLLAAQTPAEDSAAPEEIPAQDNVSDAADAERAQGDDEE